MQSGHGPLGCPGKNSRCLATHQMNVSNWDIYAFLDPASEWFEKHEKTGIWGNIPILKGSWRVWVSIHATSHSIGIYKTIYLILSDYWQTFTLWIPGCCMLQRLLVVQPCVPNILIDWKQSSRVQCINVMLIQLACLLLILYFDTFTQTRQVPTKIVLLPNDSSTIIYPLYTIATVCNYMQLCICSWAQMERRFFVVCRLQDEDAGISVLEGQDGQPGGVHV